MSLFFFFTFIYIVFLSVSALSSSWFVYSFSLSCTKVSVVYLLFTFLIRWAFFFLFFHFPLHCFPDVFSPFYYFYSFSLSCTKFSLVYSFTFTDLDVWVFFYFHFLLLCFLDLSLHFHTLIMFITFHFLVQKIFPGFLSLSLSLFRCVCSFSLSLTSLSFRLPSHFHLPNYVCFLLFTFFLTIFSLLCLFLSPLTCLPLQLILNWLFTPSLASVNFFLFSRSCGEFSDYFLPVFCSQSLLGS